MTNNCRKILLLLLFIILLLTFPVAAENTTNQTFTNQTFIPSNTTEPSALLFDENVSVNNNETEAMAELLSLIPENLWDEVNPESVYLGTNLIFLYKQTEQQF